MGGYASAIVATVVSTEEYLPGGPSNLAMRHRLSPRVSIGDPSGQSGL